MARVSIPVPLDAAETAHQRLVTWLDGAEGGDMTVAELLAGLAGIVSLLDEQHLAVQRAAES